MPGSLGRDRVGSFGVVRVGRAIGCRVALTGPSVALAPGISAEMPHLALALVAFSVPTQFSSPPAGMEDGTTVLAFRAIVAPDRRCTEFADQAILWLPLAMFLSTYEVVP